MLNLKNIDIEKEHIEVTHEFNSEFLGNELIEIYFKVSGYELKLISRKDDLSHAQISCYRKIGAKRFKHYACLWNVHTLGAAFFKSLYSKMPKYRLRSLYTF